MLDMSYSHLLKIEKPFFPQMTWHTRLEFNLLRQPCYAVVT